MRASTGIAGAPGLTLALALTLTLATTPAAAFEYDVAGHARFRYHHATGLPLSPAGLDTHEEFVESRITLTPRVRLGEEVTLGTRIEILSGVLAGDGADQAELAPGFGGGPGTVDRRGEDVESIEVDRGWLEWESRWALATVGRQASSWGLGILANGGGEGVEWGLAGNGPGRGDTVDRVHVLTDAARWLGTERDHLLVGLGVDKLHEGSTVIRRDDVTQIVASALYTNGTLRPRVTGSRELGVYALYLGAGESEADLGVLDLYGHLELGLDEVFLYGDAELVWSFGRVNRAGAVPDGVFEAARELAELSFAGALAGSGVDPASAAARAESIAAFGTSATGERELLTAPLAGAFGETGVSPAAAAAIADRVVAEGLAGLEADRVDVNAFGSVLRAGARVGPLDAGIELGGSTSVHDDDVQPRLVGPFTGGRISVLDAALDGVAEGRFLETGLTGLRSGAFPFDPEHDPALILFEEVGPLGPDGLPTVVEALYTRIYASLDLTDDLTISGALLYAQLASSYPRFRVDCRGADDCHEELVDLGVVEVVPAGRADELGVEVDLGATYRVTEHLTAELRGGYLVAGHAFGPDADDVLLIRPQVAAEW